MSITTLRVIPCRDCGHEIKAVTIESANPSRHPPFQEQLLDRTLLKMPCPSCGAEHLHYQRFMWTDLPGRLCAIVLHESERPDWPELEPEAGRVLAVPLREEGPLAVRALGEQTAIRLVFGLEELREKVLCRVYGLDDRVVETLKEDLPYGSTLEAADPNAVLTFVDGDRRLDVAWDVYAEANTHQAESGAALPGLYDPLSTWVNVARSRRAPGRVI